MAWKLTARRIHVLAAGLAGAALSACSSVNFYTQAIAGQAEILHKARPISAALQDHGTSARTRHALAVVEEARGFAASHLELPAQREYDRYTDLQRRYVSWVLFAAPEFSVEGRTWWYPFVGRLEYRGYFSEKDARAEAARLKAQGAEVYVGGVEAYSTLGWFRDPILNTFFHRSDAELAELLFHELTHVKVFLPGDSDFNEAFATANAEAAVRRWLLAKGDAAGLRQYEAALAKDREIVRLLLSTSQKLGTLYARKDLAIPEMRRLKAATFAEMHAGYRRIRQRWHGYTLYDRAFTKPWNNARLNTVSTYYDLVPGFERLLLRHHGNLHDFYDAVAAMRHLSKEERRARLAE